MGLLQVSRAQKRPQEVLGQYSKVELETGSNRFARIKAGNRSDIMCATLNRNRTGTKYNATEPEPELNRNNDWFDTLAALSVTVANLTMEAIEQKALSTFSPIPTLFLRYADDCFCVAKTSEVDHHHKHLNSIHPDMQFTVEHESNGCHPFLNLSVENTGNHLTFQVYRKTTHTGRYLHFSSDHPTTHKSSVVSALFRQALTVCSTKESLKMEVDLIKRDLRKNNYPTRFINKIYKKLREPLSSKNKGTASHMCVPYLHGTSEVLARLLGPYGIAVAHTDLH